jgi:hypothetical protein
MGSAGDIRLAPSTAHRAWGCDWAWTLTCGGVASVDRCLAGAAARGFAFATPAAAAVCQARAHDRQRVQSGMALTRDARTALEAAGTANVRDKLRYAGPGRGAAVPGFASGDITRGDIEDWLTGKEREEKNQLRRRANLGIAISLLSMAVGLAGLLVALLK